MMKNLLLLICAGTCFAFSALHAEEAPAPKAKPNRNVRRNNGKMRRNNNRRPPRSPENFRRGPGIWRAFAELSDAEKKELMKLQRTDPEKFRTVMQEKADRIYQKTQQRRQQLHNLVREYRQCKDDKQKAVLREQLKAEIRKDFDQRLANAQRNIDTGKKQIERMEKELEKRRANAGKIVDKIVENMLSGERRNRPVRPPKQ